MHIVYQSKRLLAITWASDGSKRAHTCTKNVLKTRFLDVQNVNSNDVHKTWN